MSFKYLFALGCSLSLCTSTLFAVTINTELEDKLKEDTLNIIKKNNKDFGYKTFNSCNDMDTILNDLAKQYQEQFKNQNYYRRGGPMMMEDMAVGQAAMQNAPMKSEASRDQSQGSKIDFSTTNIQVAGVDEPDIMKTNGHTIYYLNNEDNTIEVVQSPLSADAKNIDLTKTTLLSQIVLPKTINGQKNLFLHNNTLVLLAQWQSSTPGSYKFIDKSNKLMVITYDVSNPKGPKLMKVVSLDGSYMDARLVDGTLRIVAQQYFNRRYTTDDKAPTLQSSKIFPRVTQRESSSKRSQIFTPLCNSIQYVLPDEDKDHMVYPNFTYIYTVPLANSTKPGINVLLGAGEQIHMSQNNLYLLESYRSNTPYSCPTNARCMMPWRMSIGQTLIHKFNLLSNKVSYQKTSLVPGTPLTQYSMDEDQQGNFRILTSKRTDQQSTDLHILDKKMNVIAGLYDIEPGEQFKASRYMGNKLYLVTFRQTDPLFVIDLANILKPTIVGELKIPGYSTYLHPHSTNGSKQYLLGLGYDVGTNERGGTVNGGLQLALYEVDYANKETVASRCDSIKSITAEYKKCVASVDTNRVRVRVINQKIIAGTGSQSEALQNPRVFVMSKDNKIILPIIEQVQKKRDDYCYDEYIPNGAQQVKTKKCVPQYDYVAGFVGLKSYTTDVSKGITLGASYDYRSLFEKTTLSNQYNNNLDVWQLMQKGLRVGYIGDSLYSINSDFAHFVQPSKSSSGSYVMFDKGL